MVPGSFLVTGSMSFLREGIAGPMSFLGLGEGLRYRWKVFLCGGGVRVSKEIGYLGVGYPEVRYLGVGCLGGIPPERKLLLRSVHILLECFLVTYNFYHPRTKLRQGNVFTPVCNSVHRGRGVCISQHALGPHYISSCTGVDTQLVLGQHAGNIKCMMV